MIEQQGKVVAASDGIARVRIGGTSGCANCDAGKGCGAGVFGRLLKRKPVELEVENSLEALPGQAVIVGLPESLFLRLVARLYLIPLLSGVAGAALGHYLSVQGGAGPAGSDFAALLSGLAAGAVTLGWVRRRTREFSGLIIVHLLRFTEIQKPGF